MLERAAELQAMRNWRKSLMHITVVVLVGPDSTCHGNFGDTFSHQNVVAGSSFDTYTTLKEASEQRLACSLQSKLNRSCTHLAYDRFELSRSVSSDVLFVSYRVDEASLSCKHRKGHKDRDPEEVR